MKRKPLEEGRATEEGGEGVGARPAARGQIVDLEFLRGLIAAVDESGIDSVEISRAGTRIRVSKTPPSVASNPGSSAGVHLSPPPAPSPAQASESTTPAEPPQSKLVEVVCPMVGTFYRSPAPEAPPYVEVGSRVVKGQTLCVLEAMKLMNELEAEVQGIVREISVENAEPVEYGQVLFRIEPQT